MTSDLVKGSLWFDYNQTRILRAKIFKKGRIKRWTFLPSSLSPVPVPSRSLAAIRSLSGLSLVGILQNVSWRMKQENKWLRNVRWCTKLLVLWCEKMFVLRSQGTLWQISHPLYDITTLRHLADLFISWGLQSNFLKCLPEELVTQGLLVFLCDRHQGKWLPFLLIFEKQRNVQMDKKLWIVLPKQNNASYSGVVERRLLVEV